LDTGSYQTLKRLYREARELGPGERQAFLDRSCADDPALRAELEGLLAQERELGSFLEQPVRAEPEPPRADPSVHPERVASYRILEVLGWGGMGVVYLAEQESPKRRVALKILRHDVATPARLARFEREAELLGRLHHPGIAQVFEAGWAETETGRRPFFAMELVEGQPLQELARATLFGTRQKVALACQLAEAMHYAHERGVVHRDLKPSNVLVSAHGQPKILDFGVARATGEGSRATEPGQLVGTLAYMSPEQASGEGQVGAHSDVYSLGVILYELLTGRLPIDTDALPLHRAVQAIREQDPLLAGALRRELRGDLEVILAKALEKEPARRYESAADLAGDLRLFLEHRPIRARAPGAAYVARKLVRRHRALSGALLALILVLVGGLAFERVQRRRAEDALRRAELAQRKLDARNELLLHIQERDSLENLRQQGRLLLRQERVERGELEAWQAEVYRRLARLSGHRQALAELRSWSARQEDAMLTQEEKRFAVQVLAEIVSLLEELSRSGTGLLPRIEARLLRNAPVAAGEKPSNP
jgi:predicted Ser/Thr protein kinase